jgi:hypothetical protein
MAGCEMTIFAFPLESATEIGVPPSRLYVMEPTGGPALELAVTFMYALMPEAIVIFPITAANCTGAGETVISVTAETPAGFLLSPE